MANCHDNFVKDREGQDSFEKAITISESEKERLIKGRNSLRDKIRNYFKDKEKVKGSKFHGQGSYSMNTLLSPVASGIEYDLDDGIYLDLTDYKNEIPAPTTIHAWILDAVKDHTSIPPVDKDSCVRVVYKDDYHIDLPTYMVLGGWDNPTGKYLLAKKSGWVPASAKDVTEWFNNKAKENPQLRRIVKYAKAWGDYRQHSNSQTFIPSGLTLTVVFAEEYVSDNRDDISFTETSRAVKNRLEFSKVIDKPIKGTPESEDLGSSKYISETQWKKFYDELDNLVSRCDEALDEESQEEAAKIWRKLFGDRFPIYKDTEDKSKKGEVFAATPIIGRNHTSA